MTPAAEILAILAREGYHVAEPNVGERSGVAEFLIGCGHWVPSAIDGDQWVWDGAPPLLFHRLELPEHFFAPGFPEMDQ